jgi:hypothetical protein
MESYTPTPSLANLIREKGGGRWSKKTRELRDSLTGITGHSWHDAVFSLLGVGPLSLILHIRRPFFYLAL